MKPTRIQFLPCAAIYSAFALFCAANQVSAEGKPDLVAQKREQYRRILVPPQEMGFEPEAWLSLVDSPDVTQADFGRLEDLLDTRSRLYDAAARARRVLPADAAVEESVASGSARPIPVVGNTSTMWRG